MKKVISVYSNFTRLSKDPITMYTFKTRKSLKKLTKHKNNEGDTFFHQLAKNTPKELTKIFTENPRSIKVLTKIINKKGETIFHTLANNFHFNELLELIKLDSSLIKKLKKIKDNDGNTVFDMLNKTKTGQKTLAKLVTQIPPGSIKELGKIEVKMTPFTSNNGEDFRDTVLHALAKKQPHELTVLIADLIDKWGTEKVQTIIDIENKERKNVLNILVEKIPVLQTYVDDSSINIKNAITANPNIFKNSNGS